MALTLGRRIGLRARDYRLPAWGTPHATAVVPTWAVAAAALTPALLTAGWLIGGSVQPDSYNLVRDTVSALAGHNGTDRWIMTDAMFLVGLTYLITAAGLACLRPAARVLLLVAGLSSVGIAAAPEPAAGPTALHLAWTVLGSVTITIWPFIAGWRAPPRCAAVGAPWCLAVTAAFSALLVWVLLEIGHGDTLGLAERAVASVTTTWPLVIALVLRRRAIRG